MIEANGLTKDYGKKRAVDGLTFTVKPGIVTGFLGPNGSGKSTTMRLILELDKAHLTPGSTAMWFASINFLHFAALLFALCALVLVGVSLATPPPAPERVADLTYQTAKPAAKDQASPGERRVTVALSVILVATIGVLWIIFR